MRYCAFFLSMLASLFKYCSATNNNNRAIIPISNHVFVPNFGTISIGGASVGTEGTLTVIAHLLHISAN